MRRVLRAWRSILSGVTPSLSIEITRECPLRCPGCYAYGEGHLSSGIPLRQVRDLKGNDLVEGVLALVAQHRPLHVSLVGGEPLVRRRELDILLPRLSAMGVHTQVVTSAVAPIPLAWSTLPNVSISVSVDGLQPEHDERRKPATYDRILKHITGHRVTIHCTVTRAMTRREGYLEAFVRFWSEQPMTERIWISLYTPQAGEISAERLAPADRSRVLADLRRLRGVYPKLDMRKGLIDVLERPPASPAQCTFARTTRCFAPDLRQQITPCQFGGRPDCQTCGCYAAAGIEAIARHRLPIGVTAGRVFEWSLKVGRGVARLRRGQRKLRAQGSTLEPAQGSGELRAEG